jgi:hypothetical protein
MENHMAGIDLQVYRELDLGQRIGQLRAVPVAFGPGRGSGILLIYAEDAEIDPYARMFFFPTSTCKLRLLDERGETLWLRDLGPGIVPGIWFLPVFPFDLDGDGTDEIYLIGNRDPAHPLSHYDSCLEQLSVATGETVAQTDLPDPRPEAGMSHTFRYFVLGGHVRGEPVLVTAQGTYGPMALQGWNPGGELRWRYETDGRGPQGSHMCAVADLRGDGVDGVLWGERYIDLDQGREVFRADGDRYEGHSDIVQPILDWETGRWCIHTCRESSGTPRVVCFDDRGERLWGDLEHGHMDTGWCARLGPNGEPIALAVRVGEKLRSAAGEFRREVEEFTYEAFTGRRVDLGFSVYTTIPVDLNGDGRHELVKGYFEGDGTVLSADGEVVGNVGGLSAMASKFVDLPGEQILSYAPDGMVRIWADRSAVDSPAAQRRYAHPFYRANQRLTACGYNLFNLGGI